MAQSDADFSDIVCMIVVFVVFMFALVLVSDTLNKFATCIRDTPMISMCESK